MPVGLHIPEDVWGRFHALYGELNRERGWFEDAASLRFAAVTALTCHGDPADVAAGIRDRAAVLKKAAGWFGELKSSVRFIVAAMLMQRFVTVEAFLEELEHARVLFRAAKLRKGYIYEVLAILILQLQSGGRQLDRADVERFQALYEEMKRYHWWLTGPDDFPACAILTGRPGHPSDIGREIEEIYQALKAKGFKTGDPLQTAANLLYLANLPADMAAQRYKGLADAFRGADVAIWQCDYDELAILSFINHSIDRIVERTLDYRARLGALKPKPDHIMSFNLGASLAFLDLVRLDENLQQITDAKALQDMQAVINAQNAAAASIAASAAAAAAASGGSS
ncbi:MAG: DUF4003 family protein [Planctomycetota bacterium]|jgi:hypothetical protein